VWLLVSCATSAGPALPVGSGTYPFHHRDAEFMESPGFPVQVIIRGRHIEVMNPKAHGAMPAGLIEEGTLMWNFPSGKWVIGQNESARKANEVGGCGDGPAVVDFDTHDIWTCMGGP
jgi:hypothetical protein